MYGREFHMRWIIPGWPGPSADGLDPPLALNIPRPSRDPRLACHSQAIHGWPGSLAGPEQMPRRYFNSVDASYAVE